MRRHRRATRPATGGDPDAQAPVVAGDDDTDLREPARDAKAAAEREKDPAGPPLSADEQWLVDQRPPHWE